jgi:hypothetical protein
MRGALMKVNFGRRVVIWMLLIGETRTGSPISIGVKTSKLAGAENGPVFAPSSARARQ